MINQIDIKVDEDVEIDELQCLKSIRMIIIIMKPEQDTGGSKTQEEF